MEFLIHACVGKKRVSTDGKCRNRKITRAQDTLLPGHVSVPKSEVIQVAMVEARVTGKI